ncbi:MAG: 3-dehydroquinate synthase, partial [Candidatus Sedimenticola sp. 6PFRAG1]
GHTFGHAIETGMGYGEWLHGEAIAAGMCMAGDLSVRLGWLSPEELQRIVDLISKAHLPVKPPESIGREQFLELMSIDKKVLSGKLRLILMQGLGRSVVADDFDAEALKKTLDEYGR